MLSEKEREHQRNCYGLRKALLEREAQFKTPVIEPSQFNFKGEDDEQPPICHWFGCCKRLTHTEQLFGRYCIHHQNRLPFDVTKFIQY